MVVKKLTNRISVANVPYRNATLVLMNHPASLILYKYVSISCLSGTVSIMGFDVNGGMKPLPIFSSEKSGLIKMKTETFENVWKKNLKESQLYQNLSSLFSSDNIISKIMEKLDNSTVAVYVQRTVLPYYVEFAEYYYPEAFEYGLAKRKGFKDTHFLIESKKPPLEFDVDADNVASEINTCIRRSRMISSPTPRILVCGSRNTGKSTLLQYLMNRILTQFSSACYLDTDPGQPQFTPPGVVSLTEVTGSLIGPSFLHHDENAKMIFVGDISPSFIELYIKSVCKLVEFYSEQYSDQPLFVNTMGWMEGTGLQCLKDIIAAVKPTFLIEIVAEDVISMFDYRDYLPENSQYFQICCRHKEKPILSPKESRELSLLSYLGRAQSPYVGVAPINEIRPYCVSWEKVAIFVFPGGNIQPYRLAEAVNASIVALCSVPETSILESTMPDFPKTLESDPENECLAYGFVQAIDEKERLLYIISPLEKDKWQKVNAIIKGKVMVPDALILKQELYHIPLPYTCVREVEQPDEEMPDVSMISLKYVQEPKTEIDQNPNEASPSLENFRKPVGKRYSSRFSKTSRK